MNSQDAKHKLALLQRLAVAALLLAAAFPRARHLEASFDREADGERGAQAALTQLNRERLPELNEAILAIELPAGTVSYAGLGEPPWHDLIRESRSPLALDHRLEAASFAFLGIEASETEAPVEFAVRVPFLLLHLLALFVFWWAISQALGGQIALLSLAFMAVMPPALAYGTLTGTENFALLFGSLILGIYARHMQKGERLTLALLAPVALLAGLAAPETLALTALLPLHALVAKRVRTALITAATMWAPLSLLCSEYGPAELARTLNPLPMLEARGDSLFEFLGTLLTDASSLFTPIALGLAVIGIALRVSRALHPRLRTRLEALEFPASKESRVEVVLPLVGFGVLAALASPETGGPRLLLLCPAIALGIALLLQQLTRPIAAMRAGLAPLVVLASLIAMPCLARFGFFEREFRSEPTPRTVGAELRALELEPDALCVIPASSAQGRALEFYARRTLVPQTYLDRAEAGTVALHRGILPWTLTILLPVNSTAKDATSLREQAANRATLRSATPSWEVWR